MSGLIGGGGNAVNSTSPIISSMRLQTSTRGKPIPLVYGKTRIAPNLMYYTDFKATGHTTSTSTGGGKGGGGGGSSTNTTYTYSATILLGLCEGTINYIPRIWRGKSIFRGNYADSQDVGVDSEAHLVGADGTVTLNNNTTTPVTRVQIEQSWS
ncbi:hypothetical protein QN372_00840 [Undibacterium sp. RTI2.1]|uniref:hypothetical protein n=1 Tax=unclassified Undibacterium TaxID=2630295 RepID=UPI002AB4BEE3|nr:MULTISPECIES: hypothetical protein [unclassified Undibacterium]MDY7537683.1 hypothetical protein [Undibacterium sp. 5I1]MEB0029285.1 hypothetical protein [Undibacterium sp. RTI2.1]MEB0115593.1 hypothetical protein [Undibacterium sp. RTI2.2]MEB0256420.1 hypothetical protein [Undibacterium sp. 5I1]